MNTQDEEKFRNLYDQTWRENQRLRDALAELGAESSARKQRLEELLDNVRILQEATIINQARRDVTENSLRKLLEEANVDVERGVKSLVIAGQCLEELLACLTLLQTYGWKPHDHPRTVTAVKNAGEVSKLIAQLLD